MATIGVVAAGPALVSSRLNITGALEQETGELHYTAAAANEIRHYRRLPTTGTWSQVAAFGNGRYSAPCMIETLDELGNELTAGSLQLFVEIGNGIEQWILPAPTPTRPFTTWTRLTAFGTDVLRTIGALQGSNSNLEVYIERTDGRFQHYERIGINWVPGPIIP